jgi:hypothetical protein
MFWCHSTSPSSDLFFLPSDQKRTITRSRTAVLSDLVTYSFAISSRVSIQQNGDALNLIVLAFNPPAQAADDGGKIPCSKARPFPLVNYFRFWGLK